MHRPDGMGEDRHRERQNMRAAAHDRNSAFAIVTETMEIINDGFNSHQEAADWLERRLDSHPEPDWNEEEVEIQAIG